MIELDGADPNLIPVPLGVPKPEGARLTLLRDGAAHDIATIKLTFSISYEAAAFAPGDGTHHLYGAPEGAKIQHSQFKGEVFGLPVTFEHQADDEGVSATVQFPSGLKLSSTWVGLHKDKEPRTLRMNRTTKPNHALQRPGGIALPFQSTRLVDAVAELGSLVATRSRFS